MKTVVSIPNNLIKFIKSIFTEIKLVEFPGWKYTFKMTMIVLLISFLLAVFILLLDTAFAYMRNFLTNI